MATRRSIAVAFLFAAICQCITGRHRKDGNPSSRSIVVQNRAGCKIDFYWIHPHTKVLADSNTDGGLMNGGDSTLNSYMTHSFEVQELPSKKTGHCRVENECRKAYFTVSANEDQIFIVNEDFEITVEDHKTRARRKAKESLEKCKLTVQEDSASSLSSPQDKMDQITACMETQLALSMRDTADEIQFQSNLRKRMGHAWTEYACRVDTMNTTTTNSILNSTWTFQPERGSGKKQTFKTKVLFESDFSKIQRVEQFVSTQECQALLKEATPAVNPSVLPLQAKASNKVVGTVIEKIEQLVSVATGMSATIEKEPLLQVRMMEPLNAKTEQQDCSIGADGSTTCSSDVSGGKNPTVIRVSLANDANVLASVLVLCETPAQGGDIFFTKTGTTLLSKDIQGDAILILHQVDGNRDEDPFVDEYVICPVRDGRMFLLAEEMAK